MLYIRDLIRKKKEGKELSEEEINFFIDSYNRDEILKEQAAALLILMNTKGLTKKEMSALANAMAQTGNFINLFELNNKVVDIHPIGGMDDKIVIMLLAIISALNLPVFKIVGREMGVLDKLSYANISDFNDENKEQLKQLVNTNKIVLLNEPKNIAPVEEKLYKLRNDITCNDDVSIIAINLLSQKIAIGIRNVIFDISYGEKAYVKNLSDAEKLANCLIKIGADLNINVRCIITKLEEPVGRSFGNTLELLEALEALNGNMYKDVNELILEIGCHIIEMQTGSLNMKENKQKIMEVINNKKAYDKLLELAIKDRDINSLKAKNVIPITSSISGYIEGIDMSLIRTTGKLINAIRYNKNENWSIGAGIELNKKIGDKVEVGELIGYIHTNDETKVQEAVENVKEAFHISDRKVKEKGRIVEVLK